ncbi:major facilitator superfamily domain-containing protein [Chytriomyces sp. MP71]|nr:major facilitator superfamily domain-containing protein [Chytriomyces sp. MP71]
MTYLAARPEYALISIFIYMVGQLVAALPFVQLLVMRVCSDIDGRSAGLSQTAFMLSAPDYERCAKRSDVQSELSSWMQWLGVFTDVPALISLIFAGYIVDKFGRRFAMLAPTVGNLLLAALWLVSSIVYLPFPVFAVVYFISGITGGAAVLSTAVSAYIADTTKPEERTQYFMTLSCVSYVGVMIAPPLGGWIAKEISLIAVFSTMFGLFLFQLLYLLFIMPNSVIPVAEQAPETSDVKTFKSVFIESLTSSMKALTLLFGNSASATIVLMYLVILLASNMFTVLFVFYPGKVFGWDSSKTGNLLSIMSLERIVLLVIALPIIKRVMSRGGKSVLASEISILRFSILMAAVGEVSFGASPNERVFVLSTLPVSLSVFTVPTMKSILSTSTPVDFQGRMFNGIELLGAAMSVLANFGINWIYQRTVDWFPSAMFFLISSLYLTGFFASWIFLTERRIQAMKAASGLQVGEEVAVDEETPLLS